MNKTRWFTFLNHAVHYRSCSTVAVAITYSRWHLWCASHASQSYRAMTALIYAVPQFWFIWRIRDRKSSCRWQVARPPRRSFI